jgi:uncharacterized GH25 family protein
MNMRLVILLAAAPLFAHDFWIEPKSFSPTAGEILSVRLKVGQEMMGDPVPRDASLLREFVVADAAGQRPLVGRDGSDPAGYLRADAAGLLVIGYASNPSVVEMPSDRFNQYLKEEGLDAILALRVRRNQMGDGGHEMFSRCAKSLVLVGPPARTQADRTLGLTLELTAERNPYSMHVGQELPVRLTYLGKPLAGALVVAMNRLDPGLKLSARTDPEGRVRFQLPQPGMWLIKSVHMIPGAATAKTSWASYWASLTFELPKSN